MKVSLLDLGLSEAHTESARIFEGAMDRLDEKAVKRPDFVSTILDSCTHIAISRGKSKGSLRNLRGSWFEYAVGFGLIRRNIVPFYVQASLANVPNVIFDFVVYTQELGPIVLSLKTSLRERYKQSDLEAMALKYVHRRAEAYLLTVNAETTVRRVSQKIARRDILGLDGVYRGEEIATILSELKRYTRTEAPTGTITKGKLVKGLK